MQRASVWTLRLCTVTLCTDICKQFCWVSWPNKHSRSHRPCKHPSLFRKPPKTGAISDPAEWVQNSPAAFSILTTKWGTTGHVDKLRSNLPNSNLPIFFIYFFYISVFCSFHSIPYILWEKLCVKKVFLCKSICFQKKKIEEQMFAPWKISWHDLHQLFYLLFFFPRDFQGFHQCCWSLSNWTILCDF